MSDAAMKPPVRRGRSVRYRLLAIALLPFLVVVPLLLALVIGRLNTKFDALLITKVNGDLTIAHQYFARILENTSDHIRALGDSAAFRTIIAEESKPRLADWLETSRKELGLDFLNLLEDDGRLLATAPQSSETHSRRDWPVIVSAVAGTPSTSVDIFSAAELAAISPALAERARVELVPTANAAPTDKTAEEGGMVVHSASPVQLADGRRAVLVGGILLNQNLVFIDTINDLVYRQASLPEGSQGTATLFLDDVRISTNVRLFEGRRALGTRVSAAVRQTVLGEGRTWLDSAFVVNDWYISAYEPISDSYGKRVGMLYVGFLETPFRQEKLITLATIVGAFLLVTALSIPIFLRWARAIFKPLEQMTDTISRVEGGDLDARTGLPAARDEIGRVATHLDELLDRLRARDRQLRSWNEELNKRVAERTRELEAANKELELTTKQLIMSEKLAAIGEITAGVAHEINNPVAVIQGNLDVVRQVLGSQVQLASTEFRLIDEQIHRIEDIVTRLLQFARPEEFAGYVERHAPHEVIEHCLPLVQHLLNRAEIDIVEDHRATGLVLMNRTELLQVLVNLIVNAIHAMPSGGILTLRDVDEERQGMPGILIEVADTGVGMDAETLARIFDPFFTTKSREGTGLGLSISQKLILRQGGAINAESEPGSGTRFTIWLPQSL
jgi:signal transduction histidine kinase